MQIEELQHDQKNEYVYEIDGSRFILEFINGQFDKCRFNVGDREYYNKSDWQKFSKIADIIDDIERKLLAKNIDKN
jgi:hypothetical protein